MSWFAKLFTIGTNKVNEAGNKAVLSFVDISREGKAIVEQRKKAIREAEESLTKVGVNVKKRENEIERINKRLTEYNLIAERAVKAGEDADAMAAISQIEILEERLNTLNMANKELEPIIKSRKDQVANMRIEVSKIEAEIDRLSIIHENLKDKELARGDGTTFSQAFKLDDLRDIVENAKARSEVKDELAEESFESLDKKYNSTNISASERLAKMKEAMGKVKSDKKSK